MDNNYEEIKPWDGQHDTGYDVRMKLLRNFNKIADNFNEVDKDIVALLDTIAQDFTRLSDVYVNKNQDDKVTGVTNFANGLKIGDIPITWDADKQAIKIGGSIYAIGGIAAMGAGPAIAGGGGGVNALEQLVDIALTNLNKGDSFEYDGTHWVNKINTDGLTDADGIIVESPEEWLKRIPLKSRRIGMEVTLRTSLHDDTYTRYRFREGTRDQDLLPVDFFIGIEQYIIDSLESNDANKALSARQGKILRDMIKNKKLNCGTYG